MYNMDEVFKSTIAGWYKVNIEPVFEQARQSIINDLGKAGKLNIEFEYWWASYIKNSVILFELMMVDKYSNQTAFTMRLVMEIAADSLFVSDYPENVAELRNYYTTRLENFTTKSYTVFSQNAKELCLYEYKKGKKQNTKTTNRIQRAFGKEGLCFYEYLCCYTHLNYAGIINDINKSIEKEDILDYRLQLVKFYPESFMAMIRAAEKLSGENNLFSKIDIDKIKTAISDLVVRHSLGKIE